MLSKETIRRRAARMDKAVGSNVRHERLTRHMSQERLASAIGVTFQQVQKYEIGSNRIAAGRLYDISEVFGVKPGSLFPASRPRGPSGS